MSRWMKLRIGTNHSSHAEKKCCNKFAFFITDIYNDKVKILNKILRMHSSD